MGEHVFDKYLFGGHGLLDTVCVCGGIKAKRQSLCKPCYHTLDKKMRNALYRKLGSGYEQAFDAAVAVLIEKGRIKQEETDGGQAASI